MRTRMIYRVRNFRWALGAAVLSGLWLAPALSWAQDAPGENAAATTLATTTTLTLYEVQEGTDLKQHTEDVVLRLANAAIVGTATGALCAATGQDPCAFDTLAKSNVPLNRGFGPLNGAFELLFDTNASGIHLLSDLVQVADGRVTGTLDLRPVLSGQPVAFMDGEWRSRTLDAQGTFTGTFLIPIADPSGTCSTGFAYLDPSSGLQCLTSSEISLTRPVTKVLATFVNTGPADPQDKEQE